MIKSLNSRINALRLVSNLIGFKTRLMIANGIFMSKLTYLIPLWAGCEKHLITSLQLIQNKAARLVTKGARDTPIRVLLGQCGWLSVMQLGVYHSLVLTFKVKTSKSPYYLYSKLWDTGTVAYGTRSVTEGKIRLGRESQAVTGLARSSFIYRIFQEWNSLPLETRQAENLSIFKLKVRKWIAENVNI